MLFDERLRFPGLEHSELSMTNPRPHEPRTIALHGGEPAFPEGPPQWPKSDPAVLEALQHAFQSGDWGRYEGNAGETLVQVVSEFFGVAHAVPCSSGTIAVELALRGLRVAPGEEVILAGYDFSGNFRAIEAIGAKPVLVDIDPETWCLDIERLASAVSDRTKAVIVSHLHGGMVPMRRLCQIAEPLGLAIVEDACQSPGAMVDGRMAGSWGHAGVLSFGGSKLLTAGRGGMVLTNHEEVKQRIVVASERGNNAFPISELQAAVLMPQFQTLRERNELRLQHAEKMVALLRETDLAPVRLSNDLQNRSAMFRLAWRLPPHSGNREEVARAARAEGIPLDPGFRGFAKRRTSRCRRASDLRNAENASSHTLLLHHAVLLENTEFLTRTAEAIRDILAALHG